MPLTAQPPKPSCKAELAHIPDAAIRELQRAVDEGHQPWRLDSSIVARQEAEGWIEDHKFPASAFLETQSSETKLTSIHTFHIADKVTLQIHLRRMNEKGVWILHKTARCTLNSREDALTVKQLVGNASKLDGKVVVVTGIYDLGFEWSHLFCLPEMDSRIWVEIADDAEGEKTISDGGTMDVVFEGVFRSSGGRFGHSQLPYKLDVMRVISAKRISRYSFGGHKSSAVTERLNKCCKM